jgi:predicted transcriptional regulator
MAGQLPSEFGGEFENQEEPVREAVRTLRQQEEDLAAIQEGLADMNAGRYRPLAEVDAKIRKELGFSATASAASLAPATPR